MRPESESAGEMQEVEKENKGEKPGSSKAVKAVPPSPEKKSKGEKVKIRKNFNETAFFYPDLKTNEKGEIIISFQIPESLTKWKMMGFAHTKDLKYGFVENELGYTKRINGSS